MIVIKNIGFIRLLKFTGIHLLWLIPLMTIIAALYYFDIISFKIPWVPVSVIGTAVAFYVGFQNNQSYDRLWEARKIWGGIVNDSRAWGMMVDGFITNQFTDKEISEEQLKAIKQRLIYRHIGWLYAHRSQLLIPTPWEHIKQSGPSNITARKIQKKFGVGLIDDEETQKSLNIFLPVGEFDRLVNSVNTATQIVNEQSRDLRELRKEHIIDDFRHITMENVLRTLYEHQGKNERIKNFPLPRQYANMSRYFIGIFIALLPFSLIPEMRDAGNLGFWLSVPIVTLVGWMYIAMELVGDYSENPFSGMANDIPMLSLCRNTEIDLREMLGEKDLPPVIEAKNGVLM